MTDELPQNEPNQTPRPQWIVWLSKPWVILLLTFFLIAGAAAFSINEIMNALLHARPEVLVPNIERKGLSQALSIVSALDLSLKQEGMEFDDSLPAGTVLRQQPPAGMQVRAGRTIRVYLSKGGQSIYVPEVIGRPLVEAQSILSQEGLQVGAISEIYSDQVEQDRVTNQMPSSGTVVTRGVLVDLEISKGAAPAGIPVVPDFMGQSIDAVREWAKTAGIKLNIKEDAKAVGSPGTVVKQDPNAQQPAVRKEIRVVIVSLLASEKGARISYRVPEEEGPSLVRMVARDNRGESEVYAGEHHGGELVEVPLNVNATTRVRIYVNGLLKDERVIEP